MSAVAPRKQEQDFTKEVDELIPKAESLSKTDQSGAIDQLLTLEKQTRNAADLSSTSRILISIIHILFNNQDLVQLRAHIALLAKKHGQLRQAVTKMVDEAMTFIEKLDGEAKVDLIETLREVTDGKIYVEVQRARLTRQLANIKESQGDSTKANDLMQDVAVETFGSMDRRDKIDFILEQMRLLQVRSEWEKLAIVAKKINSKWLAEPKNEDLKLRFYGLMISYALEKDKYLDLCKYYRAVYESTSIQENEAKWSAVIRNVAFFAILAPYDNEQSDLLHRVAKEEKLPKVEGIFDIVKCFTTPELMRWPGIQELYGPGLRKTRVFGPSGIEGIDGDVNDATEGKGEKRWTALHDRIVEHNVRVISKYYTRLTMPRLAQLLDLTPEEAEKVLARLVTSKTVYARINRPLGLVSFEQPKSTPTILNEWNSDVGKLLDMVEKTVHLVSKEYAINAALRSIKKLCFF